jgi:hypothetical protein
VELSKNFRLKVLPYQPLQLQGKQGAEEEQDPDHGADDQAKPEDPCFGFRGGDVL